MYDLILNKALSYYNWNIYFFCIFNLILILKLHIYFVNNNCRANKEVFFMKMSKEEFKEIMCETTNNLIERYTSNSNNENIEFDKLLLRMFAIDMANQMTTKLENIIEED